MIAEEYRVGGTCVIRGCVPKKLMVYRLAHSTTRSRTPPAIGWTIARVAFDWPTLLANKDKEIARLEGIYTSNVEKAGAAAGQDPRRARRRPHAALATGERVTAEHVLVATGGAPNHGPDIPGIEHVITSERGVSSARAARSAS